MTRRIRDAFDGSGLVVSAALFFFALGFILIPVVFSSVRWTGTAVHGIDRGGIVYYTYQGQNYSLDDTSRFDSHTVYFNPKHPDTSAELGNSAATAVDIASVAVPFLIALAIVAFEARRLWRVRRTRNDPAAVGFGHGLDLEVVHRLLDERRRERS